MVFGWDFFLVLVVVLARPKGGVRRHSVLTDVVVSSYLWDVLVMERWWMVNTECVWILPDIRVSDHFQIW